MAKYVDGFVIKVKKKKMADYKKMAKLGKKVWLEHGALDYYECEADEFVPWGLGFQKMCNLKKDETVVFSFIVYKSKAHRNKVNEKVHSDPRMDLDNYDMPFDPKGFALAGFNAFLSK